METNKAYENNPSFSFHGEAENIDVEQEIQDTASSMDYDPYRLAEVLLEIGQRMTGIKLYTYQKPICFRVLYSILARDGAEVTALFSRQSGKSEVVVFCVITLGILLPVLAKIFPKELGHFKSGIKMGLLAPQGEQVQTIYSRCMERLQSEPVRMFLDDPDILDAPLSTVSFKLKSGSFLTGQSAAKQSKIESKTYNIVFLDESQDMDTEKVRRSIIPMTASTFGTIVRTGTPSRNKGDFYYTIVNNKKSDKKLNSPKERQRKQLHFEYHYKDVIASKKEQFKIDNQDFHLLYEKAVDRDKKSMGENSDYFRMAYKIEWILEIGMFITEENLEEYCYDKRATFRTIDKDDFVVAGIDIASARADTVITLGIVDNPAGEFGERPKKDLAGWLTISHTNYEEQFHIIAEYLLANHVKVLFSDYTGVGRALTDVLIYHLGEYMEIVPYTFSPSSKSDMWKALDEDIINRNLSVPAHKNIRNTTEFKMFEEQMLNLQKFWKGSFLVCEKTSGYKDDFCLSMDTEILTNNGFKLKKDLLDSDLVANYDSNTGEIFFDKPLRVFSREYSGEMIYINGEHVEQLVTENHKTLIQYKTSEKGVKYYKNKIVNSQELLNRKSFKTDIRFPVSGILNGKGSGYKLEELQFICWMITEGWENKKYYKNGLNRYFIGQSIKVYPKKCDELERIFKILNLSYGIFDRKDGVRVYQFKIESSEYIQKLLYRGIHSFPTDLLYRCTQEELNIMYKTLMDADGCWSRKTYTNKSLEYIEGFQILLTLIGKGVVVKKRFKNGEFDTVMAYIMENKHRHRYIKELSKKSVIDEVWCVTVKSGFIVIRYNNKISITGNCDSLGLMNLAGNYLYSPPTEVEITENNLIGTQFRNSMKNRSRW